MKFILKAIVLFILIMSFNKGHAQAVTERRPQLFSSFANTINFPASELEKICNTAEGSSIQLSLEKNMSFTGTVISSLHPYENLQSIIVRLDNLDNTVLGVSKIINDDKSITYKGRIINHKYADAFELRSDASGKYFINKIKTQDLVQDHE